MLERIRDSALQFISNFSLYDISLMLVLCFIAMCFMFISLVILKRKMISFFIFSIGLFIIFAMPFTMKYFMEEKFYKVEVDFFKEQYLAYVPIYYLDVNVKNIGQRKISGCYITHTILYDTDTNDMLQNYRNTLLNYLRPRHIFTKNEKVTIVPGESKVINLHLNNYKYQKSKHINKVQCYGA